jgi:hypothetical protein
MLVAGVHLTLRSRVAAFEPGGAGSSSCFEADAPTKAEPTLRSALAFGTPGRSVLAEVNL